MNRSVKVSSGSSDVSKIVFGNASEEESPVVSSIELCKNIEVFDSLRVLSVCEGLSATIIEYVLVVLCIQFPDACHK